MHLTDTLHSSNNEGNWPIKSLLASSAYVRSLQKKKVHLQVFGKNLSMAWSIDAETYSNPGDAH
jgi:hypothetical protein